MVTARTLRRTPSSEVDPDDAGQYAAAVSDDALKKLRSFTVPKGYIGHRKQQIAEWLFNRPGTDLLVLNCGRRSGKSELLQAAKARRYHRDWEEKRLGRGRWEGQGPQSWSPGSGRSPEPFLHYVSVAPIYKLLAPNKRKLQRMLGNYEDPEGGWIVHQTDHQWWLAGGILIDWRSGDNPNTIVAEGYDGADLDEFARMKPEVWDDNLQPALADSGGWAIIVSTPMGKGNHFYRVWAGGDPEACEELQELTGEEYRVQPGVVCATWTTMDNTAVPKIVEFAKRLRGRMPDAMWRRNFLASWVAFIGQCFDLERGRHFSRTPLLSSSIERLQAGMDFGFSPNPGVFVTVGKERRRARWHQLAARSAKNMVIHLDNNWARRDDEGTTATCWTVVAYRQLKKLAGPGWRRVKLFLPHDDPSAKHLFKRCGFRVQGAYVAPGSRRAGMQWFQMATADDGFVMHDRVIYSSFEGLRHPDTLGDEAELWVKENDHGFDACRYALSPQIERGRQLVQSDSDQLLGWMGR